MSNDFISKKTRNEFREYFVGTTLREIEMEFDAADVPFEGDYEPEVSGMRRSMVEQYYHGVNWSKWRDVRRILTVYENVLGQLEDLADRDPEWAAPKFRSLVRWLKKDGFEYNNGKFIRIGETLTLEDISESAAGIDMPEIQRQIDRMRSSVDDDPSLAIGTAKELVETTCKTILDERNIEIEKNVDITKLVKETRKCLDLMPESIASSAKGAEAIRRLLSNLGNVVQGIAELRNLYGTGHGKHGKSRSLSPRHARLVVGSAATLVTFLFETHTARSI